MYSIVKHVARGLVIIVPKPTVIIMGFPSDCKCCTFVMLSLALMAAFLAMTVQQRVLQDDIFDNNVIWPNPEELWDMQLYTGSGTHATHFPNTQFKQDLHLIYFTKDEYASYGQHSWSENERNAYSSYQYPFDYVVQKQFNFQERLVRFLNYSITRVAVEKHVVAHFMANFGDADRYTILTLTTQRMYRYNHLPCAQYVKLNFTDPLVKQVFRHTVMGYDKDYKDPPHYREEDVYAMSRESLLELVNIPQRFSDAAVNKMRRQNRLRLYSTNANVSSLYPNT